MFLSLVAWGATLGLAHPFIHRPLHESIETAAGRMGPNTGTRRADTRRQ